MTHCSVTARLKGATQQNSEWLLQLNTLWWAPSPLPIVFIPLLLGSSNLLQTTIASLTCGARVGCHSWDSTHPKSGQSPALGFSNWSYGWYRKERKVWDKESPLSNRKTVQMDVWALLIMEENKAAMRSGPWGPQNCRYLLEYWLSNSSFDSVSYLGSLL